MGAIVEGRIRVAGFLSDGFANGKGVYKGAIRTPPLHRSLRAFEIENETI